MSPFAIPRILAAVSALALVLAPVYLWLYGWFWAQLIFVAGGLMAYVVRGMCREVRRTRRHARIVNHKASAFGHRVDAYRASVDDSRVVLPFARREVQA